MAYPPERVAAAKDTVCHFLAQGISLVRICQAEELPDRATVNRWMESDAEFATRCARAREDAAEAEAQRLIEIADDLEIPPDHKKHMISVRQWNAMKLLPKKYGDKQQIELDAKVETTAMDEDAILVAAEAIKRKQVSG